MQLILHLVLRLVCVTLICLMATVVWVMVDAHRAVEAGNKIGTVIVDCIDADCSTTGAQERPQGPSHA